MTKQEFENRVKVTVDFNEFEAINLVYMNSDLEKDDFCAMWRKMNRSRVNATIAESKEKAVRDEITDHFLFDYEFSHDFLCDNYNRLATSVLSEKSIAILERAGIDTFQRCWEIRESIHDFIHKAA